MGSIKEQHPRVNVHFIQTTCLVGIIVTHRNFTFQTQHQSLGKLPASQRYAPERRHLVVICKSFVRRLVKRLQKSLIDLIDSCRGSDANAVDTSGADAV